MWLGCCVNSTKTISIYKQFITCDGCKFGGIPDGELARLRTLWFWIIWWLGGGVILACGWCVGGGVSVIAVGGGVIVLQDAGGIISKPFVSCCNFARLQLEFPEGFWPTFPCTYENMYMYNADQILSPLIQSSTFHSLWASHVKHFQWLILYYRAFPSLPQKMCNMSGSSWDQALQ